MVVTTSELLTVTLAANGEVPPDNGVMVAVTVRPNGTETSRSSLNGVVDSRSDERGTTKKDMRWSPVAGSFGPLEKNSRL